MLKEIFTAAHGLIESIADNKRPAEIIQTYPAGSAAAGTEAGRFHLKRGQDGSLAYDYRATARAIKPEPAIAEVVTRHDFQDLESLAGWMKNQGCAGPAFVHGELFGAQSVTVYMDPNHPERGFVHLVIPRHPTWLRWDCVVGHEGKARDLDHLTFAELLADNTEDLEDKMVAKFVGKFRAARKIEYDAEADTGATFGVRVTWGGSSTAEPTKSDVGVPREIIAQIPVFGGAWPEGKEAAYRGVFRTRVMAPKSDSAAMPIFRVLWANALAVEYAAIADLRARVQEVLGCPTFAAAPSIERFILPTATAV